MNGSLKVVQGLVLLSLLTTMFSSCGGSQSTLSSNTTSGTVTTSGTTTTSGTSENEEEEKNATIPAGYSASNLFVTVPDTVEYLNLASLQGSYNQKCTFTSASVVNDLTCNVEIGELALFFNGIKFQFNVPANACKYIRTTPYWFYNFEVGYGPSDVQVTVNKDASGTVTSTSCVADGSAPYSCSSLTPPVSAADIEVDISDEIKVKCAYDTSDEDGGKNCCFGKYRLRTTINAVGAAPVNTDERGKDWGGSLSSCIAGAGKTSWDDFNAAGRPLPLIENVPVNTARTKIYKAKAPIETTASRYNLAVANYFTGAIHTHTGYGPASGTTATEPYFINPVSDRSGTRLPSASPYYDFECLDEAFETNYRIRMMVQEWNKIENLTSYISSGVSGTNGADENGTAPTDCNGIAGESCNQVYDLDDFLGFAGGSYSIATPSNRKFYFPQIELK